MSIFDHKNLEDYGGFDGLVAALKTYDKAYEIRGTGYQDFEHFLRVGLLENLDLTKARLLDRPTDPENRVLEEIQAGINALTAEKQAEIVALLKHLRR